MTFVIPDLEFLDKNFLMYKLKIDICFISKVLWKSGKRSDKTWIQI